MKLLYVPFIHILLAVLTAFLSFTGGFAEAGIQEMQNDYPQRIVSLGPINTENVFLLGAGERLVGNTEYCVRPKAAQEKLKVGSVLQFSIEKILSLQPDLVLATGFTQPLQLQQMKNLGLRVVQFPQPNSLQQSCEQFLKLGRLLGEDEVAEKVVERVQEEVRSIKKQVAHLTKPKVLLQIGSQPLHATTKEYFTHDFIEIAGGINIVKDLEDGKINYERVIAANPDVIIIAIMGSETGVAAEEKKSWQRFVSINAVKNNRIYTINPDLACSPSPATFVQALRIIASYIHPESMREVHP